ncbi:hypothetical protein DS742_18150 [Lacrimispora amygdalina]|uniref:histidine kinase n=1 Tax=Lacrimispora amygdalina TaxID=253257 RepID=A0A3E2N8Z1_9FIRM|nr:sensor histidine kinase [Clostridium indicum]RFZ77477.1 hypothetical protein DS742_18150 [Clostridium indicum]
MKKSGIFIRILLFLLLILIVLYWLLMLTKAPYQETPELQKGHADLSGFDLDTTLATLPEGYFTYYPSVLYTPEDVEQGRPAQWTPESENPSELQEWENYGTYRMTLTLPAGRAYGISAYSAMYSQRLYVNGEELSVVGIPGATVETTLPDTNHYTVYFTPDTDQTEILIQVANFHHSDGGGLLDLTLGTAQNIGARDMSAQMRIHILVGFIVTAFLVSMGLLLFFQCQPHLWYSLVCLTAFVRIGVTEKKDILFLLPDLPWEITLKLEYLSIILLVFSLVMYINSTFPGALNRYALAAFGAGCAAYSMIVLLTPSVIYTDLLHTAIWVNRLFLIYIQGALILRLVCRKDKIRYDHLLLFAEVVVFIIFILLDTYWYRRGGYRMALSLTTFGLIVFALLNMIVQIINFSRTSTERNEARLAEQEIREKDRLMERLNHMWEEFLQTLSHELRTPLTKMANCAGLTALQIRRNAIDDDTLENLEIIKQEASRLSGLVEGMKKVSLEADQQLTLADTDAKTLLVRGAGFCESICDKKGNQVMVKTDPVYIPLRVNGDGIFQVVVNLIVNANRHTEQDVITLTAESAPDHSVRISITDHGDGIGPDLLPHVFERNVSGDGSTGLGLAICREIIEEHGGTIEIQSNQDMGTTVSFTLPSQIERGENT